MGSHNTPKKADVELSKAALEVQRSGGSAKDIAKVLAKASPEHQAKIIKRIRG